MASESFRQYKEWLEAAKTMADELEAYKVNLFTYYLSIMPFT